MKKILFVAIAMMMSLMANAQQLTLNPNMGKGVHSSAMSKAPAMAPAIEGTSIWGYYTGDFNEVTGLGTQGTGTFGVCIKVPADKILTGAKIKGVNLPALTAKMSNVKVFGGTAAGNSDLFSQDVESVAKGYNAIVLDEEVEIPAEGMYVGYSFTITSTTSDGEKFPMGIVKASDTRGALLLSTDGKTYADYYGQGFGVAALQIFVADMNLPENSAEIAGINCIATEKGTKGKVAVDLLSTSNNGVSSVDYELTINGAKTTGTATLSESIPNGLNQKGSFEVEFDAPETASTFPANITITGINGKTNEVDNAATANFNVVTVTRVIPHMVLVEEATGTGCGWCTRGWVGMEMVKKEMADKALVVAAHWYNTNDPMYVATYDKVLPKGSAPLGLVDRRQSDYIDPYYGVSEEGIKTLIEECSKVVPTVDIKVEGQFADKTNKAVNVKATTEFLTDVKNYRIAFVLTADELTGSTSAWKQSNYYYQYTPAQVGVDPETEAELASFCKGGSRAKSSVTLVFNDVMIGGSYSTGGVLQTAAFTNTTAGSTQESTYTITMPTKSTLVGALQYDKIYVTAFIIDDEGNIANAVRARVLGAGEVEKIDIQGVKVSDFNDETQVMGEAMSPNAKYVVGTNYATFAPIAWNVETNEYLNFAEYEDGAFHAANSNGIFVGDDGDHALKADADGNVTKLYRFEGETVETEYGPMSTGDAGSSAYAISEDGKTVAGFYFDASYKTTPCLWTEDNVRVDLPLPTAEQIGFSIDGGEVRYMSNDGKVLAGFLLDNFSTWPACIWRQNETGGYDVDVICQNYWEESYQQGKPYMVFNPTAISANGEWLALSVQKEFDDVDFNAPMPTMQMARMNLTNNALEVLEDDNTVGYAPTSIANDGTMVAYTGGNAMLERVGYIWPAEKKETINLNDILVNSPELENLVSNTPSTISADGKYIQGFGLTGESLISYVFDYDLYLTGVDNVKVDTKIITDRIYNINGQQVNNMNARGLYIVNGKKCVVK